MTSAGFEIAQLADRLQATFFAASAAVELAKRPDATSLLPPTGPGNRVPVGRVEPGTTYSLPHFLAAIAAPGVADELTRVVLGGGLLALGDALSEYDYVDRSPVLELVRHLRNAVAHGNRFEIRNPGGLATHPAHMTRGDGVVFEITPELDGEVCMFEFVQPADVLTIFHAAGQPVVPSAAPSTE